MKIRMAEDYVYDTNEDNDYDDGPTLVRRYRCSDGMCGALDCPRCRIEVSEFYNPAEEEAE